MGATLVYVHDPLCGWCFGFASALDYVRAAMPEVTVELRLSGLVVGERIVAYSTLREYIERSIPRLMQVTGRAPGPRFMDHMLSSDTLVSSNPPSAALLEVRKIAPDRVVDAAYAIQRAHFDDGLDLNQAETLHAKLAELNLSVKIPGGIDPRSVSPALAREYESTRGFAGVQVPGLFVKRSPRHYAPVEISYRGDQLERRVKTLLE